MLEFLLVAPLPGSIEGAEHLSEQLAVFGGFLEIAAAAEDQLLLQPLSDVNQVDQRRQSG
jgi:hypothetical protein